MVFPVTAIFSDGARTAGADMVGDVAINKEPVVVAADGITGIGFTRVTLGEGLMREMDNSFSK